MSQSRRRSKPATFQPTNRELNPTLSPMQMDVFAVMKDGSIFEMTPEDVRFLLGGDPAPVAYRVVHVNGNTSDFRQANLDLVRDDVGAAKALHL
jgi:hypothetical protein